ncbi:MAG: ABC transporter ATP-binding protein, partial [Planctomycetota bacterium]
TFLPRQQDNDTKFKAILYIIFLVGFLTVIRCIAKFYQGYLAQKVVQIGVNHLREDVFSHIMHMPLSYFANERPSDAVSRIIRDTSIMGNAIKVMLGKALREPLNALFLILAALWINWQLTLIFMGGAPFVLVVVGGFGKKMKRATKKSLMVGSLMLSKLNETMAGLRVVKVYNQQGNERTRFTQINNSLLKQLLKISKVDAATSPVLEILGMAAGCFALAFGAKWVTQTKMDATEFLVLLGLLGVSAESIRKTSGIWNKIQEANAAAERVFGIMDEPLEFEKPNAIEMPTLQNNVEFRNVIFSYPASERPVLNGVNLTVKAGQTVALVGPNGSGKTTLVNLIPRFYDIDDGSVLIDGTDVRDCTLKSLRSQIGMVTQNVVTFNDTVASNIAYGKDDATENQIIEAAKRAFADEFITMMPDGYDTVIGEQGAGLSGGQLQRIVIARAILNNPAILIFDEATSQVDADSEAKIHKAVEEIMKERTSFIIAHRFSTIINADLIVVMDDGRIIDQGRHEQLIKSCPLYQSLYETQLVKG